MRRIVIIGTALAVLVGASAAYAAFNSYSATISFSPSKAGTPAKPVALQEVQNYNAMAPAGDRAAPLTDIKTTIYGLKSDGKDFPKCSASVISSPPKYDAACPPGSMVASGAVHAILGSGTNPSQSVGIPCNPGLHVYNSGQGHLQFFFYTDAAHQCAGLRTGATAPYPGTYFNVGKNYVLDVPLPPDVSTKVANQPNFYGSLVSETLTFRKISKRVHGKLVAGTESIGCKHGKRPYKVQFTATLYNGGGSETRTVTGNSHCS